MSKNLKNGRRSSLRTPHHLHSGVNQFLDHIGAFDNHRTTNHGLVKKKMYNYCTSLLKIIGKKPTAAGGKTGPVTVGAGVGPASGVDVPPLAFWKNIKSLLHTYTAKKT